MGWNRFEDHLARHGACDSWEEPDAGKPFARIRDSESQMAELLDHDPREAIPAIAMVRPRHREAEWFHFEGELWEGVHE
jgi:hypothetical protein